MNNRISFIFLFMLFISLSNIFAQNVRPLQSSKYNGKIEEISKGYVYAVVINDAAGNMIYRKEYPEFIFVKFYGINDELGCFYITESISDGDEGNLQRLYSISLPSGTEVWSVETLAFDYILSPNGKYFLTKTCKPGYGNIEIINLKTGKLKTIWKQPYQYFAEWYDSSRVIIAARVMEPNNEYIKSGKAHYATKMALLRRRLDVLSDLKRQNKIHPDSLDKEALFIQELSMIYRYEMDSINGLHNAQVGRRLASGYLRIDETKISPVNIFIYNITTSGVENQTYIISSYSEKDSSCPDGEEYLYGIDAEGNSYLICSSLNDNGQVFSLTKIDAELNFKWTTELPGFFQNILRNTKGQYAISFSGEYVLIAFDGEIVHRINRHSGVLEKRN